MAHDGRLHLVRAERADRLVGALADVLAEPAADPFTAEVVAVPTRGIERWLAQELSLRLGTAGGEADGVCANIEFPFPATVVARALAAACGREDGTDPWAPGRLVWPLLETIDAHLAEDWLAPLRNHLGGPPGDEGPPEDPIRRLRRFGAARHLADLFDRYGVHRPSMLLDWAAGRDVDGAGGPLDDDVAWQPELWRRVRGQMEDASPAERLDETVARLREGLAVPDLPDRMGVFGLTALPASFLRVLAALATHRAVHLFLLHPSPVLWDAVAGALDHGAPIVDRDKDTTRGLVTNPLLGSWGRDAREMQLVVTGATALADRHVPAGAESPTTLLQRLQADVRADRLPAGAPVTGGADRRPLLAEDDRSVQVHACHGRTRQVEVLRDAVLHALAEDPTLEPRDILVMCPDIEAYAPIVQAVFDVPPAAGGAGDDGTGAPPQPDVRVKLADRAIRQTNPVLRVVADLLERAGGRLAASEVLDLASREPVRRRFRFDDDDLTRLESWVADAQIRWGLDGEHRAAFALGGIGANTWRAGLDRILLGVTMADQDDRLVAGTAPLDDVEGTDVDLVGRLAELVDRLTEAIARLQGPQPIAGWRAAILCAADLLTATGEADRWQRIQLDRLLDDLVEEASGPTEAGGPSEVALALAEVTLLLSDRLRGRPSRANHRTGDLTVCTLVPMRSVPHRVICLLGMDDGAFPRRTVPDGDDLIDRVPRVGDRDPRTEDRQLLLDALLAAADTLVVTYSGNDVRTNDPRPPAVPVGELLDVVDATVRTAGGTPARDEVRVVHPLQPFDPRNFSPRTLGRDGPWGFDGNALDGARAKARGSSREPRFLAAPLGAGEGGPVALDDLVAFVQHPVRAFLRQRLDVSLPRPGEEPSDAIAVELAPLEQYALGERLLATRLAGADEQRWAAAERARGVLPPGALADRELEGLHADVDAIAVAVRTVLEGLGCDPDAPRRRLPVEIALAEGRRVVGAVPGLAGDAIVRTQYARVGPKHRLAGWVRLVAATAAEPHRPFCAVTIGRFHRPGKSKKLVTVSRLGPLGDTAQQRGERSRAALARLVDLYERGMREPLPLYCKTSAAYAEAVRAGKEPTSARSRWVTTGEFPQEDVDPAHRLVLGGVLPFEGLLALPPCDDEHGDGWSDEEPTRVGRYARRLWDGLLDAEEIEHR